jgi:hypothetical protein
MEEYDSISHDDINKYDERFLVLKYVRYFFGTVCRCTDSIRSNDSIDNKFHSEHQVVIIFKITELISFCPSFCMSVKLGC